MRRPAQRCFRPPASPGEAGTKRSRHSIHAQSRDCQEENSRSGKQGRSGDSSASLTAGLDKLPELVPDNLGGSRASPVIPGCPRRRSSAGRQPGQARLSLLPWLPQDPLASMFAGQGVLCFSCRSSFARDRQSVQGRRGASRASPAFVRWKRKGPNPQTCSSSRNGLPLLPATRKRPEPLSLGQ